MHNRLNFAKGVSAGTPFDSEQWTPSNKAPFQTFHWTHYLSTGPGKYTCTVYAVYFAKGRAVRQPLTIRVEAGGRRIVKAIFDYPGGAGESIFWQIVTENA